MEEDSARRVCYDQLKIIMDFMGQHPDLAMGNLRSTEARHKFKKLWQDLAKSLNSVRGGSKKTPVMWSRYWSDFKNKLKRKARIINRKVKNGSSGDTFTKGLTKLEKRALVILGPKFVKTSRGSNTFAKRMPAEVKIEDSRDSGEYYKELSETSDRLSTDGDGDKDDETEESSPEENGDDMEIDANDFAMSNIYPKWLIDVEKKRAEAELIRARAEEQRVEVAVKSAEASLIQAEALKRLSEAATVQADALMRIAGFLESRGHNSQHMLPL